MILSAHGWEVPPYSPTPNVLVIGGGISALSAVIAARCAGADVRLIESAPRLLRGGNARHARNLRAVHDAPTRFSPGQYMPGEFVAELGRIASDRNDPHLSLFLARESAGVVPWLAAHGVPFQRAGTGLLPMSRRTSFLLGGGKTMMNVLYGIAEKLGATISYDSRATTLTLCGDHVAAVDIEAPTGQERLHPHAVALCCGGGQASGEWLRPVWGDAVDGFINRGTPYDDGALLQSLIAQNVATSGDPGAGHLVAVDARSPPADGGIATRVLGIPQGIVVDRAGRRFHDEGGDTGPTRYAVWGRKVAEQPQQLAWLILDAMAMRQVPPLVFPPLSAPTMPELAALAGLDTQTFAATVDAFNAAVRDTGPAGHTVGLCPAKTRFARPLSVPPFAAIPIKPGITFTCLGVKVDANTRVMTAAGTVVANLFAAGTIMAANVLGNGYLAGAGLTIAVVCGRRAGEAAAFHAKDQRSLRR